MKVLGINGSARRNGNTALMLREVFKVLEENGIETELVELGGERIRGCQACDLCAERKDGRCAISDDCVNSMIEKMAASDGIILGSPVYFSNVTAETKALIDRTGRVVRANDYMLKGKVGAAVVAVRRAGSLPTFDAINHFFLVEQMIIPGSTYWNLGMGKEPGQVLNDEEGMENLRNLGENMSNLVRALCQNSDNLTDSNP